MRLKKYRVVDNRFGDYAIEGRYIFSPFWFKVYGSYFSVEEAITNLEFKMRKFKKEVYHIK